MANLFTGLVALTLAVRVTFAFWFGLVQFLLDDALLRLQMTLGSSVKSQLIAKGTEMDEMWVMNWTHIK